MPSVGEQIVQAMVTALNGGTNPPCPFQRTRVSPQAQVELPNVVVYAIEDEGQLKGQTLMYRRRRVRFEITVAGDPPTDSLTDPIYVYTMQTLLAAAASGALGKIMRVWEAKVQWETESSYEDASIAALDVDVYFFTTLDPTVWGAG